MSLARAATQARRRASPGLGILFLLVTKLLLLLLLGVYAAYRIRNIPPHFNESRELMISIANITFVTFMLYPITDGLVRAALSGRALGDVVSVVAFMYPKMSNVLRNKPLPDATSLPDTYRR